MKKLLLAFLAMLLVLSLTAAMVGCTPAAPGDTQANVTEGNTEPPAETRPPVDSDFLVGFGAGDLTPYDMSVPLMGYGESQLRMSKGYTTKLYAHALAVRDKNGNTAIMISVDSAALTTTFCNAVQSRIENKTGVPAKNIILSAIHQHSTPDYANGGYGDATKYNQMMMKNTTQAAVDAIADLSPAEIYITSTEAENLTFVRNYVCEDGSFKGPNYPSSSPVKDHESVADVTLQLLKFVRGGDKKDIIVSNFQSHPLMGSSGSSLEAHADYVGPYRDYVEDELDVHCMYFSGAAGNLTPVSEIARENVSRNMWDHGEKLGKYAVDAESTYTKVNSGDVKVAVSVKNYNTDKSQEHLYDTAVQFMKVWNEKGQNAAQAALKDYPGLRSIYHGKYVVIKHDLPSTRMMTLYAISFGDVAFTGTPCELYDQIGDQIKSESPAKMTIVTTQTNGCDGYIPSALGYQNGGYSVDITRYAAGTGEQIASDLVKMIQGMQ